MGRKFIPLEVIIPSTASRDIAWATRRRELFQKAVDFLKENGVIESGKLMDYLKVGSNTFSRLLREYSDEIVYLHLAWASGGKGSTKKGSRFIKSNFLGRKFIGLKYDRTALVKFFMNVFVDREYGQYDVRAITSWLKRYGLTRAERVAIITRLGYKYTALKHIMIDGWLNDKPSGRPHAGRRGISKGLIEKIKVLIGKGFSGSQVAMELGISSGTVYRYAKKLGLKLHYKLACRKCGFKIKRKWKYCPNCAEPVENLLEGNSIFKR